MKIREAALALAAMSLCGCVYVTDPNNYRPQSETLSKDFYSCSQQSNQPTARVAGTYGSAGMAVNPEMLLRCMEAHDYHLRKATGGEWAAALIFLPITVPLTILSACGGVNPWVNARFGGGNAEP